MSSDTTKPKTHVRKGWRDGMKAPPPLQNSSRDWTEDFPHENGNYVNRCHICDQHFFGHKRRMVCKVCDKEGV